ncbi:MAG: diaminopimelate epimerase [Verrucomicrobiae bacterium]|nr:diaminopimelate epimerase [Verrucomicrobiae bacterium]
MTLNFWKMNGAGNDFVVLDNRDGSLQLTRDQIARLCHRQRGVGADGLLAVEPAEQGADFRMRYYNADGGEAEMCGNGARCFAKYARSLDASKAAAEKISFETIAGVIKAEFDGENIRIELSEPFDLELDTDLAVDGELLSVNSVNTGVPHAVVFVEDLEEVDVRRLGSAIRHHSHFSPAGTNANFVQVLGPDHIAIRTYERGVEDETLACGTGMVACAIVHFELNEGERPIRVQVRGGETLEVTFRKTRDGDFKDVTLLGPAEFTYQGTFEL